MSRCCLPEPKPWRRVPWLLALALFPTGAAAATVGPSFACPAHDPLARTICARPDLAALDLAFVQTYQALRQQSPDSRRKTLGLEARNFADQLRRTCTMQDRDACVRQAYTHQRALWDAQLTGAAAEEAARPLQQHIALQGNLQALGLLPATSRIDGIYTGETRDAIMAFQQVMGVTRTGTLGNRDAALLSQQVARRKPGMAAPPGTGRPLWDGFVAEAASYGLAATLPPGKPCSVLLELRHPEMLANAMRKQSAPDLRGSLLLLKGAVSAHALRAAFQGVDAAVGACSLRANGFTTDLYGQETTQLLFAFSLDRKSYDRIVWGRFDTANLPGIVSSGEDGPLLRPPAVKQAPAGTSSGDLIAQWSGSATMVARPFHVDGAWEMQWKSSGPFEVILHLSDDASGLSIAKASARAESAVYRPEGGTYYLEVRSLDPWSIRVVTIPNRPN